QRFAHRAYSARPSVAVEGKPRVGLSNGVEQGQVFTFRARSRGVEVRVVAGQSGGQIFGASREFSVFGESHHRSILAVETQPANRLLPTLVQRTKVRTILSSEVTRMKFWRMLLLLTITGVGAGAPFDSLSLAQGGQTPTTANVRFEVASV